MVEMNAAETVRAKTENLRKRIDGLELEGNVSDLSIDGYTVIRPLYRSSKSCARWCAIVNSFDELLRQLVCHDCHRDLIACLIGDGDIAGTERPSAAAHTCGRR